MTTGNTGNHYPTLLSGDQEARFQQVCKDIDPLCILHFLFCFHSIPNPVDSPLIFNVVNRLSTKESQPEEDPSVAARLQRLTNDYEAKG
jgi:hypothetical protein